MAVGDSLLRQARPLTTLKSETKQQRFALIEAVLAGGNPIWCIKLNLPLTEVETGGLSISAIILLINYMGATASK